MDTAKVVRECDLIIKNAYVLTMDSERRMLPDGAVAIGGSELLAVGPSAEVANRFSAKRTIDARGGTVHPGFVDCHTHLLHTIRGAYPDWVERSPDDAAAAYDFTGMWCQALTAEDEHAASLLACLELVHNGTTCFVEAGTVFETAAAAAAAEAVGIRAFIAPPFLFDTPNAPATKRAPSSSQRALELLDSELWRNKDTEALVRGYVCLWGIGTASAELETAAKECADAGATFLSQHQSFTPADATLDEARFGAHPMVMFAELGVLGQNCLFSHMNIVHNDEIGPILDSQMSICWCPLAEMMRGTGGSIHGRHADLLSRGGNVTLGSDAATLGGRFDVGFQGALAILTSRERPEPRHVLYPEHAIEMATLAGAKAVGLTDEIGSLEVGKRADLVVRSNDYPESNPGMNRPQGLVFAAGSKSIDIVIVNGKVVVEDGHSTTVDEPTVYEAARQSANRVMNRLGLTQGGRWPRVGPDATAA